MADRDNVLWKICGGSFRQGSNDQIMEIEGSQNIFQ